jgi:hypothetical protein
MGEQLTFPLGDDPVATLGQLAPTPTFREFEPRFQVREWGPDETIAEGDVVTLVHRTGRVKAIKVVSIGATLAHMHWPTANDQIELVLRTGKLRGKHCKDWRIERSGLRALRRCAKVGSE